jgi:Domain of unknown function (DUF5658)
MTHRLPVLLLVASAVIALPERANAQEAAVISLAPFCDTVTPIVPDDSASAFIGEGAATSMQPAVFADAIAVPTSGTPPADSSSLQSRQWAAPPPEPEARPPGLLALYAGFATLQALDAHSTIEATRSGYRESNPVVAPFTQTPAAMYAFKAATTTLTILLVEKLRKTHRGAAIGLMVAANVAYAGIVASNYSRSSR